MPAMRRSRLLVLSLAVPVFAACADDPPRTPPTGTPTTITITADRPLALVAFRDGIDAPWQPATMIPLGFEAVVHGPYVVTAVCDDLAIEGSPITSTLTRQIARTLDDPHEVALICALPPTPHTVTGLMMQPGRVHFGARGTTSMLPDWSFLLPSREGTFDLVATAADRFAVRRAIAVQGDLALTPPVDVAAEGAALVDVAFTATNAAPDETTTVSVGLLTPTNVEVPAFLYSGPLATAKAAPEPALLATDIQSASVRATRGAELRALRRRFRVGDDLAYTLPPPVTGARWTIEAGALSVRWTSLPDLERVLLSVSGSLAQSRPGTHQLELSRNFRTATGITHVTLDTSIPGYQARWKVDLAAFHSRQVFVQEGTETEVVTTSSVTEFVSGATLVERPAHVAPELGPIGAEAW
jgi:hypothetical protein